MSAGESQHRPQTWISVGLAALICAVALFAGLREQAMLTIAIHQGVEGVALKAAAQDFSTREGLSVAVFELPYDALYNAEMEEVSAPRSKYDVIMVDDPWLPALIGEDKIRESRRLESLDFSEGECRDLRIDDFVPSTLRVSLHPADPKSRQPAPGETPAPISCRDAFYALPFVGNSQLFVTRGNLQPATWEEVLKITRRPADNMDAGYVARVGAGNSIVTDFMPILWTYAPGVVSTHQSLGADEGTVDDLLNLHPDQARAAFRFFHELGANPGANRGVISVDDFDLTIHLVQKHASMTIAWSAWVMAIAKLPSPYNLQFLNVGRKGDGRGELTVTQVPGGQPALGAWLLSIPARAEHKVLARRFLLFATAQEQLKEAAKQGNPPPRRSVLTDSTLQTDYPFFKAQLQSLSNARPRPRTPQWRDIERVLGDCLSALYDNAITEDDAWKRVNTGLEPIRLRQRAIAAQMADGGAIRRLLDQPLDDFSCQRDEQRLDAGVQAAR
jgi:multiple sugar transport system substrate-binding protein